MENSSRIVTREDVNNASEDIEQAVECLIDGFSWKLGKSSTIDDIMVLHELVFGALCALVNKVGKEMVEKILAERIRSV